MKKAISLILCIILTQAICHAESLPRIEITYDQLAADVYHPGTFKLIEKGDTIQELMTIRHRGASSLQYDKPSYAVKLCDSTGTKVEDKLLGMRKSHYWILDAMAIDKARMRNRVAMDLWLEFSRKPWYYNQEPKLVNGYQGQMVEVYVNGSTQGIYCLMERVDRKQLKTQKYVDSLGVQGAIYKNTNYTILSRYWQDYRNPIPTDQSGVWDGFEQKEPDWEDGEPICWKPLERHINAIRKTTNATHFADTIITHLDIPVFIDYVLFTQLLSARDNVGKNLYLSFYHINSLKVLYTPWDLDHSWGRQYNSKEEDIEAKLSWENNYLYIRMRDLYHLEDSLSARYAELRKTYFSAEHIDSLFAPYFELYARTGMDTVEAKLWSGHNGIGFDIPSEQSYIHDWAIQRLKYLDKQYHYTPQPPMPTDITTTTTKTKTKTKYMQDQKLYIQYGTDRYDIYGRKVEHGK